MRGRSELRPKQTKYVERKCERWPAKAGHEARSVRDRTVVVRKLSVLR